MLLGQEEHAVALVALAPVLWTSNFGRPTQFDFRTDPRMGNSLDSFDHSVEVPLAPKSAGACHAIDVADEPLAEAG